MGAVTEYFGMPCFKLSPACKAVDLQAVGRKLRLYGFKGLGFSFAGLGSRILGYAKSHGGCSKGPCIGWTIGNALP